MIAAARLLRLYPRAWRDRYGEEFLELTGGQRLQFQQVIDIVSGAIDAWLSSDVRGATRAHAHTTGGASMDRSAICRPNQTRYTRRDGAIGAGVILLGTLAFTLLGVGLQRIGYRDVGLAIMNSGYMVAMLLSMPFWLMKGQPWRAQAVIIGGTAAALIAINFGAIWLNAN